MIELKSLSAAMPLCARKMLSFSRNMTDALRRSDAPILVFAAALGIALCATNMLAQSGAGSIQGTVTDSTGALVPAAAVHVVNAATGVATSTKSNSVGFYQVPGLFTGSYRMTVSAPDMKTYIRSIDLLAAQNAVVNPVMTAGAVSQQVVVSGDAVQLVTTDNGVITSTLENARINQLPMNGRDLATLTQMTTPGLESTGGGQSIDGLAPRALEYTVDGTTTQNNLEGGVYYSNQQLLDPDSVQEVRMVADGGGAQYATPATAIITTKSGANTLHGTAFWTARNNALGIAKDRQDPSNYSAPHYVRNEEGASLGGPIVLPHLYHGKDKSFFFFAYERYSLASSSVVLSTVPTVAMSQGDFSGLINSKGILQTLYDPSTTASSPNCAATGAANAYCRTPFPNNQIPVGEESPVAKLYYQLAPLPTNSANPLVTDNLTSVDPQFVVEPQETFRLDHVFNENNRAYLRYTQNLTGTDITGGPRNRPADGIPAGAADSSTGYLDSIYKTYLVSAGYTHIFSPTFFAETIASQQWLSTKNLPGAAAVAPTADYESMLGLPNNFGELGFPNLGDSDLIFNLGTSQTTNGRLSQIVSTLDENLTKVVGRHQMQFGGRFRHQRSAADPAGIADLEGFDNLATAVYNPSTGANYTALTNTGYADGSFFLGSAYEYTLNKTAPTFHNRVMEYDAYFQDNYHLTRNLTLNLGLRYEAHPGMWTKDGLATTFDLKNDAEVLASTPASLVARGYTTQPLINNLEDIGVKFETPAEAGMPANTLLRNYDFNFLPRAGLAYQLFGGQYGTVIRGAYGRYIAPTPLYDNVIENPIHVPFTTTYTQSYTSAAQAVDGLPNELLRYNDPAEFGVMGFNTANVVNTNATNGILPGILLKSGSPDAPPTFNTETNFTIEQTLKGNSALRISWIWTHASNLTTVDYYNNAPSTYQWEMATGTVPPTGGVSVIGTPKQNTYSATATRPYDQTTWGASEMYNYNGWSNDNILQANYQRLYHHGVAYQISYDFSKPMEAGGDDGDIPTIYPYANFPGALGTVATMTPAYGPVYAGVHPPAPPAGWPLWADYHAMDKFLAYTRYSAIPIQDIAFNGIVDLPFGRGKRFLGNANRFLNELVGGFQLAGDGSIHSQIFQPSAGEWGAVSPVQVYKHKYPITDCRSGVCEHSYMWSNGYLAPTVTQGVAGSTCTTNCVTGLPANYVPFQTPIDNTPGTTYYGDNEVQITASGINSGKATNIVYDAGPGGSNYLQKSWLNGPINYTEDISIFKVFPIKEGMNLRFNADAFNALNVQGWNNPGTNGVETNLSSYNTPRQIQLTMRLTF